MCFLSGRSAIPDYGPATVAATAFAVGAPWELGLGVSAALGLVLAVAGGWSLQLVRRSNARAIQHSAAALAAGEGPAIRRLQYGSLLRDAARGALLTTVGLLASWLLASTLRLDRATALGLTLVAVGSALSAAVNGAHSERGTRCAVTLAPGRRRGRRSPRGAPVNGSWRALLRLLAVQGTWNYERMLGVGMGYAAEPLLEDLKTVDPVRHSEAVVRSTDFFNCHPNLAGLALGAIARAEYDAMPGPQIVRLRTALCSPLGSLGDQLFWAGLVPGLSGLALAGVVLGAGWWVILGYLVAYNLVRLGTARWALQNRSRHGHAGRGGDRTLLGDPVDSTDGGGGGIRGRSGGPAGGGLVPSDRREWSARWERSRWPRPGWR